MIVAGRMLVVKKKEGSPQLTLSNHEIVTLAVFLVGGDASLVDTEDVAVKANELAPGRFSWRKYPTQINIENVRAFLSDAKKQKNGSFIHGSGKAGWLLTERGRVFAKSKAKLLSKLHLARKPISPMEKRWMSFERARMLADPSFRKFRLTGLAAVTEQEAESFFRLDGYVVGQARERKLLRFLNAFGDHPELGSVVRKFAQKVREAKSNAPLV